MTPFGERLQELISPYLRLTEQQLAQLEAHYRLLERWNSRLNLSAVRSEEDAITRHYGESLFLASVLGSFRSLVDVGSGAGFPGIPLAICNPSAAVVLVESHQRKAVFLREASAALSNVTVLAKRFESFEGRVELVTSRAVAWSEISRDASRVEGRVALLVGWSDVERISSDNRFQWSAPVPLPWDATKAVLSSTWNSG